MLASPPPLAYFAFSFRLLRGALTSPSLTIGLPVLNAAPYLGACLRSIFAQTFTDWELIIVDDASTDGTLELLNSLRDPRVLVFADGRHLGLGARLNEIVRRARSPYIARMDADDLMHPERLRKQLEFLRSQPAVDAVGCSMIVLDSDLMLRGVRRVPTAHADICARPLSSFRIAHATMLGKRDWFAAHPYDESARGCEDWRLLLDTYGHSQFANLAEPLYFYREYDSYSLRKYLAAKRNTIEVLWRAHHLGFRRHRVAAAIFAQFARMAVYSAASPFGLDRTLLQRRSAPADSVAAATQVIANLISEPCPTDVHNPTKRPSHELQRMGQLGGNGRFAANLCQKQTCLDPARIIHDFSRAASRASGIGL
ncbi:MAG: glycosyltransferase family 2 protein [Terriglobales bacterium]